MSAETIEVVKATAPVVAPKAVEITQVFYPRLFRNAPEAALFFNKANQRPVGQCPSMQAQALADAVVAFASNIEDLAPVLPCVAKIAHRHVALNVTPELYAIVHENLMGAIGEVLGDVVTPEIAQGWSNAVLGLAQILTEAEERLYRDVERRRGGWRGFRDFRLVKKQRVAQDTVSFDFAPVDGYEGGFEFTAGQYLSIRTDPERSGVPTPRHYTCTSAPGAATLQCTTRLVAGRDGCPDGAMSSFMHGSLSEGDVVRLSAPVGTFTPESMGFSKGNGSVALVSAGIGITPMFSMAASSAETGARIVGAWHCDRSAEFDLSHRLTELGVPKVEVCYSEGSEGRDSVMSRLGAFADGVKADHYVLCGPLGFMRAARQVLEQRGAQHIHMELFGTGGAK